MKNQRMSDVSADRRLETIKKGQLMAALFSWRIARRLFTQAGGFDGDAAISLKALDQRSLVGLGRAGPSG